MGADELKKQEHLKPQNAATVDPSKLTALSPEVVSFVSLDTEIRSDNLKSAILTLGFCCFH